MLDTIVNCSTLLFKRYPEQKNLLWNRPSIFKSIYTMISGFWSSNASKSTEEKNFSGSIILSS